MGDHGLAEHGLAGQGLAGRGLAEHGLAGHGRLLVIEHELDAPAACWARGRKPAG